MKELKKKIKSFSCYRKVYIFTLFFCNVSFLQIPAYILVAFLFCWGIWLTYYKQKTNNTFWLVGVGIPCGFSFNHAVKLYLYYFLQCVNVFTYTDMLFYILRYAHRT